MKSTVAKEAYGKRVGPRRWWSSRGKMWDGSSGGGGWGHTVLTVTRSVLTFSDSSRKSGHRFQQRTSLCAFCR